MNKPEMIPPDPRPLTSPVSTGQILSSAREKWDLSIEDIAHSLNLGVDTIKALEQNAYDQLPGSTFIKGYIRAYAKLLDLDQEKIMRGVELAPERMSEIPATRASLKRIRQPQVKQKKSGSLFFRFLLFAMVISGLVWVAVNQLPNLDMNRVSELLKLPAPTGQVEKSNEITFPAESNQSGESKSALIRIEPE